MASIRAVVVVDRLRPQTVCCSLCCLRLDLFLDPPEGVSAIPEGLEVDELECPGYNTAVAGFIKDGGLSVTNSQVSLWWPVTSYSSD